MIWWLRRILYRLYYRHIYLHSPHWLRFRSEMIEMVGGVCEVQGCASNHILQVHHLFYLRLGKELPSDVRVLCKKHHGLIHQGFLFKFKRRDIRHLPPEQ